LDEWWLPNEEGLTPIVKSVRNFVEERTQQPSNQTAKDVKDMKAMFTKLTMEDSPKQSHEDIGSFVSGSCLGTEHVSLETLGMVEHDMHGQESFGNWNSDIGIEDLEHNINTGGQSFVGTEGAGEWIEPAQQDLDVSWANEDLNTHTTPYQF
jgi:hypothetical protein